MQALIPRIDNVFLNTRDVDGLSGWYAMTLGIPVRRRQVEADRVMWCEIGVGGMELSFRLADGAPARHPELRGVFAETPAGAGATVSYEVRDTPAAREALLKRGATPAGSTMACTDGQELITAYRDPAGVIFQTYEARFPSPEAAIRTAKRASSVVSSDFGLNLRDVRGLGLGATIRTPDPRFVHVELWATERCAPPWDSADIARPIAQAQAFFALTLGAVEIVEVAASVDVIREPRVAFTRRVAPRPRPRHVRIVVASDADDAAFAGYMEGAVRAGERAAFEVMRRLALPAASNAMSSSKAPRRSCVHHTTQRAATQTDGHRAPGH